MPITKKGEKIMSAMKKEYGEEKGEKVFYASKNKGTIKGVELKKKLAKKMSKDSDHKGRLGRKPKGWYTDSRNDFEKKLEESKDYF